MGKLFGAINVGQVVTFVFMTGAPVLIRALVKDPGFQDALITLAANIGAVLLVILRKPSDQGGTAAK